MTPIIVFYHGLLVLDGEILPPAIGIVYEQMQGLQHCGLLDACSELRVGINGGSDSRIICDCILPGKARVVYHGRECRNENRTILMVEEWVRQTGGEAYICYAHSKGARFPEGDPLRTRWRNRMFEQVVLNWRLCLTDLEAGYEAVGCHYLTPESHPGLVAHPYFAGNYWFAKASFLRTLPSINQSPAVKTHGLDAVESRYESESWVGQCGRRPRIRDYCPGWPM